MRDASLWKGTAADSSFPALRGEIAADVAIVGGGITGITAAMLLSQAGKSVVVLEALSVGLGTTGHSTGNLYATVDDSLYRIGDKWGQETATAVAKSRSEAVNLIEQTVAQQEIPCNFARRPHYLLATDSSQIQEMEQEYKAVLAAGIDASMVDGLPLPVPNISRALKMENQAQFHPLIYVRMLARNIASARCQIFEKSKVVDIERLSVYTAGGKVNAKKIILATHTPKGFNIIQTELGPYREYGLAGRLKIADYPEGIFWTLESPAHSIRSYDANGDKYLLVLGENHKTGQHDNHVDYYQKLEQFARSHFDLDTIDYRWSAQGYRSADLLPFIGKTATSNDLYIATGFGTNGLVYGTLAAMIIADEVRERKNPWREIYDSRRFSPVQSAKDFVKENVNVAKQYFNDYLTPGEPQTLRNIKPGEGALIKLNGERMAVYRDENNKLAVLSAVCTHLGCLVHWNRLEKTWDCPCHGSRFGLDGEVLEGPAITALDRKRELE